MAQAPTFFRVSSLLIGIGEFCSFLAISFSFSTSIKTIALTVLGRLSWKWNFNWVWSDADPPLLVEMLNGPVWLETVKTHD